MHRYPDRFESARFENDEPIELRAVSEPIGSGQMVPEGIFARLVLAGRAYDLHVLGSVLTWGQVCTINSLQCESLLDELAFVAELLNDPLVAGAVAEIEGTVARCARSGRELTIDMDI